MFTKMLLDALHKAPPRSVDDLAVFFERSRARLEQSLDKSQVTGEERERYLAQFQAGLNEAQVEFLNSALDVQSSGVAPGQSDAHRADVLKTVFKQPITWALVVFALVLGVTVGVLIAA